MASPKLSTVTLKLLRASWLYDNCEAGLVAKIGVLLVVVFVVLLVKVTSDVTTVVLTKGDVELFNVVSFFVSGPDRSFVLCFLYFLHHFNKSQQCLVFLKVFIVDSYLKQPHP